MKIDPQTLYNTLITMVVPVFAGFIAAKAGVLKDDFAKKLSTLILFVCQPFMLATATLGVAYSNDLLIQGLMVLLCGFIGHAIAAAIGFGATSFIKDKGKGRILEHCIIFGNCGFFGFPIAKAVLGDVGVFYAGFFVISFNIIMWSYGVSVIGRANKDMKIKLLKIFVNAGTVPCTLGFLLYVFRVPIYGPVLDSMKMIGDTCTPLSMILVGIMLSKIPIKKYITEYHCYYVSAVKLFIVPLVTAVILTLVGMPERYTLFAAIMMSLPTASSSAMFAQNYELHPELAAQTVGISTLISVVTIPPTMQLIQNIVHLI